MTEEISSFSHLKFPEEETQQESELPVVAELVFASTGSDFCDKEKELIHVWEKLHPADIKKESYAQ